MRTAFILAFSVLQLTQIDTSHASNNDSNSGTEEIHVDPEYVKNLLRGGDYEEFAELLQVDHVNLEIPVKDADFDDLLAPDQIEKGQVNYVEQERQGINFQTKPNKKWENNVVPYVIYPQNYTDEDIKILEHAIDSFNSQVTNIQFRKRKNEQDYVAIYAGTNGCYSHLGRNGGVNRLALQPPGCMKEGTIQHEMMHTVGFTHEHNSPGRDKYIEVLYDNIPKDWHKNYDKADQEKYHVVGKYDYYSIMHYPMKAPHTRLPAFKLLGENVSQDGIGQRLAMTKYDVEKINNLYSNKDKNENSV